MNVTFHSVTLGHITHPAGLEGGDESSVVLKHLKLTHYSREGHLLDSAFKLDLFSRYDFECHVYNNNEYKLLLSGLALFEQLLTLSNGLIDCADAQECLLWQIVHFTIEDHLETTNGLSQRYHHTWQTGELLGNEEGL